MDITGSLQSGPGSAFRLALQNPERSREKELRAQVRRKLSAGEPLDAEEQTMAGTIRREAEEAAERERQAAIERARKERERQLQIFLTGSDGGFVDDITGVGPRYANATFENFVVRHPGQQTVVDAVSEYVKGFAEECSKGAGIVLFGPSGTGKDHLLVAAARVLLLRHNIRIRWKNGLDIYGDFRDAFSNRDTSEERELDELCSPQVLIVSDPLPPAGSLTEFQSSTLLRVMDRRYRALMPTWITCNVASGIEAENRMGVAVWERMKDASLCCFCNWPSFRKGRLVGGT